MTFPILSIIVFTPIVAGMLILLFPAERKNEVRVTALAAAVLYLTAISSVRGFALTLGVATLLDLFVVWFFKRPAVFLIARNDTLVSLRGFGLESGVAADHEVMPAVAGGSR